MDKVVCFATPQRILIGANAIESLPDELKRLKSKRPCVITEAGVAPAAPGKRARQVLDAAKIDYAFYDQAVGEPTVSSLATAINFARDSRCDLIIGLGGGSAMDTAKGVSIMLANPGKITDYVGTGLVPNPGIPTIQIATTAGTGSEVTNIAIFTDDADDVKKGVVSDYLFASTAIADPALTLSLPPALTAYTGMDAMTHSIECFTSLTATSITDVLALRSIELLAKNLRTAFQDGENISARAKVMEGSLLAGIAFNNAGVAAVHALAYPLGGKYRIAHGLANSMLLPFVMKFNKSAAVKKFVDIAAAFGCDVRGMDAEEAAELAVQEMDRLIEDLKIPKHFGDLGVPESALPELAENAAKITRLMSRNPRPMGYEDALAIYREAY